MKRVVRLVSIILMGATLFSCAPVIKSPGPPVGEPGIVTEGHPAIVAADGTRLPLRFWLPRSDGGDKPPLAAIVAVHGMNDYANAFEEPGAALAGLGIAVYAYDQRGFGQAPDHGYWPGSRALADDASLALGLVARRHPGVPVYLLGESMGGAVAILAMTGPNPPPAQGLILVAPAVWDRSHMNLLERGLLWLTWHTVPGLKLSGKGLGVRASDNDAMLLALARDPLFIKATRVDVIHGVCDLMDEAQEQASRLAVPTLVLYGEHDEIIPADATFRMMASLNGEAKVKAIYANGWHMLLRDLQAKTVVDDIAAWIAHPGEPLPSGADAHAREVLEKAGR